MKKLVLFLLCLLVSFSIFSAEFENQKLQISFDIEEGTDTREFGFSSVPVKSVDASVSPFLNNTASFSDNDNDVFTIIGTSEKIYLYWKVLSKEDFELELSGTALTTENADVSDPDLKTIDYGVTWKPLGYEEGKEDSALGFGSTSSSVSVYTADEVYKHSPSTTNQMNNYDCIELVLTTEDAQAKVPGSYTATLTLGVKTTG